MARLPSTKLAALKRAFTEDAMQPTQAAEAAQAVGVSYEAAKRYYALWSEEIKQSLESKLLSSLEASVKRTRKRLRR